MTTETNTTATLINVLRVYRDLVGRKLYALLLLMPLSAISEGFGIALLLPLLQAIGETGNGGESSATAVLDWLPLPDSPIALLVLIAGAFALKAALKFVTEVVRGYFQAMIMLRLKSQLVESYTNLSYSAFAGQNTGHYVNIIAGQINRFAMVFQNICQVLTYAISAAVFLAIAALANWQFAAVGCAAGLVFMLALRRLNAYVRTLSRQTAREQSHLNHQLVQMLHALKYLMATDRTGTLVRRIHDSCDRLFGYQVRSNVAQSFTTAVREPLSVIVVLGLIAIHLTFFDQALGTIVVALLLLHRATQALFNLAGSWQRAMQMIGSSEMIQDELKFAANNRERRGAQVLEDLNDLIQFQDVSFAYDAAEGDVLHSVNLRIPRNQTIALVGHSGAGKSTLADLLTLLLPPSRGRILIDGQDTCDLDPKTWRRQLGYVCQETVVFDDTIAANICLSESDYRDDPCCRDRVHEAARQAFATDFIDSLPAQYNTVVGDRGVRLSGGQRQRLFIARELYKCPNLLILDEATSALDGESERVIQQSLEALHGQLTVVVIAHRLATIKNADYIYVLDGGRVVEHGPYERLHSNADSRFRRMVELQAI